MATSRLPTHRVAAVVFADAPGVDRHDAGNRLVAALGGLLPARGRRSAPPDVEVLDVVELGTAARNGYLTVRPAARLPHE